MEPETITEPHSCDGTCMKQEPNTGTSQEICDNSKNLIKVIDKETYSTVLHELCFKSSMQQGKEHAELNDACTDKELQEDFVHVVQKIQVDESPQQTDEIRATADQAKTQQASSQLCETTLESTATLSAKNLYITMCADNCPSPDKTYGDDDSVYHKIDCIYDDYSTIDDSRNDLKNTTNSTIESSLNTFALPCGKFSFVKKGIIILLFAIAAVCVVSFSITFTGFGHDQPEESRENIVNTGITINFCNLIKLKFFT